MNSNWGSEINYAPDYWPLWLIIAVIVVGLALLGVIAHGVLRYLFKPEMKYGEEHKKLLYPTLVRVWHWCNALLFVVLLITGVCMHFTIGSIALLVSIHKLCGYGLIICWLLFLLVNATQGNAHHYRIQCSGWLGRCWKQAKYYLFGIMKGESHPFTADEKSKFNPIQQVFYAAVMYIMLPLFLLTGLAAAFPDIFSFGLQHTMFFVHQCLAIVSVIFMIVHVYLCTTGDTPTQTFKSMIDGYHRHLENKGRKIN